MMKLGEDKERKPISLKRCEFGGVFVDRSLRPRKLDLNLEVQRSEQNE